MTNKPSLVTTLSTFSSIVLFITGCTNIKSSPAPLDTEPATATISFTLTPIPTKDARNGKWWTYPTPSYSTPTVKTQDELATLLEDNAGCALPCFLGVLPGETTLDEAENLLLKYNIEDTFFHAEGYDSYGISTFIKEGDTTLHLDMDFHVTENVVSWIEISTEAHIGGSDRKSNVSLMSYYSLREIVQKHGAPSHVYIAMEERFAGAYSLYVIYESKMAIYLGGWARKEDETYYICPNNDTQHVNMAFVAPSNSVDIKTLIYDIHFTPSLEEFANITEDNFYHLLLDEEPPCFTINFDG